MSRDIDLASEADIRSLLDLLKLVDGGVWTENRLRWQHFENPAGVSRLYVIRDEDKIVSLYAAVAHVVSLDGKIWAARRVQDVMTHPEYRGQGCLHELARQCANDLDANGEFGFTFPNKQSEGSFRRTGWLEFMPITLYVKGSSDGIVKNRTYMHWRYSEDSYTGEGNVVLKRHGETTHICEMEAPLTSWTPIPGFIPQPTGRFMFTYPFKPASWALTHGDSDVY